MKGPVIVGGIGGSGTRVVASILQSINFFIGEDLNRALDNLTYTFLFRRPEWFKKNKTNKQLLETGISILEKSMITKHRYSIPELIFLFNCTLWFMKNGLNKDQDGKIKWTINRLLKVLNNKQNNHLASAGWGWKEPNTHINIIGLYDYFPKFKYIYTIRNGLDMAFSSNQNQLINWGTLYGVNQPKTTRDIPLASFRYWVEANKRVLVLQEKIGKDKIYLLNFDKLCLNPEQEINNLINFLSIEVTTHQLQKAISIPKIPATKGRYMKHDLSGFNKSDLEFLKELGFQH